MVTSPIQRVHYTNRQESQRPSAWTSIDGFLQNKDDLYKRIEETVYNTAYDLETVAEMLKSEGWTDIHCALEKDLNTPLVEPEKEKRVFFAASK